MTLHPDERPVLDRPAEVPTLATREDDALAPLVAAYQATRPSRRDVLAGVAAAAALPLLSSAAKAQRLIAPTPIEAASAAPQSLSVGYLAGSNGLRSLRLLPWELPHQADDTRRVRIVPAAGLPLGDQSLAGESVRVRVHGLYPRGNWRGDTLRDAALVVWFPEARPGQGPLPFIAWAFRRSPVPSGSPPVSFVVPLGPNGELDLETQVVHQAIGGSSTTGGGDTPTGPRPVPNRLTARFTVDWQSGVPKLQRGTYFLGLGQRTWANALAVPAAREAPRPELRSIVVSVEPIRRD